MNNINVALLKHGAIHKRGGVAIMISSYQALPKHQRERIGANEISIRHCQLASGAHHLNMFD